MTDRQKELIDAALEKGILSTEQYRALEEMAEAKAIPNPDERFRVMNGFGEIFVSVGLFILFGAVSGLLKVAAGVTPGLCIAAGAAWFAAKYFTKLRPMLLPAIVCCLYAASYVGTGVAAGLLGDLNGLLGGPSSYYYRNHIRPELWQVMTPMAVSLAVLIASAWRFRIPFLMLPIGILFTVMMTVGAAWDSNNVSYRLILGLCGLLLLGVALHFDLKDPSRTKRSSDFAFWCYVIGSPLTVHSLMIGLLFSDLKNMQGHTSGALLVLIVGSLVITGIALLINRRALILSTLIYLSVCLNALFSHLAGRQMAILVTMLLIGLYVVCLGTAWRRVRHAFMSRLKPQPWFDKLPPF